MWLPYMLLVGTAAVMFRQGLDLHSQQQVVLPRPAVHTCWQPHLGCRLKYSSTRWYCCGGGALQQQLQGSQGQHISAVSVLAAAAAAVAAPHPAGPCLALSLLLLYVVLLLQQVLPVLGQMLSVGHASAAGEAVSLGVAIERRLRAVVQQLEGLGQQAGGYQQQQDGLHAGALQLGLQLVDLCCFLLNDAAPREAVSQQLAVHAHGFVAEAGGYLTQSQQ
jgi:hypothetical protein